MLLLYVPKALFCIFLKCIARWANTIFIVIWIRVYYYQGNSLPQSIKYLNNTYSCFSLESAFHKRSKSSSFTHLYLFTQKFVLLIMLKYYARLGGFWSGLLRVIVIKWSILIPSFEVWNFNQSSLFHPALFSVQKIEKKLYDPFIV